MAECKHILNTSVLFVGIDVLPQILSQLDLKGARVDTKNGDSERAGETREDESSKGYAII